MDSNSVLVDHIPNLEICNLIFIIKSNSTPAASSQLHSKILQLITQDEMAPFYSIYCQQFNITQNDALFKTLAAKNTTQLSLLDSKITDAQENLGESDISDALVAKAMYLARIGDKTPAETAFRLAFEKTVPLGHRIDIVFSIIRLGFFFADNDLITRNIEKAKSLIELGGDWDRRNRLKVYEAVYLVSIRDFKGSVNLFLDTLATFTSTEVMEYKEFVRYTILAAALTLNRPDFKLKIVNSPEVLEVIHEIPNMSDFVNSLYNCNYAKFFESLASIETTLKSDRVLAPHCKYYIRELRIAIYNQLLQSYRSLTIESMAKSFNVSEDWIDNDLSKFISAGRVNAVIDKVGGVIETNRPDAKNSQYQSAIKQGDILLTRIQKLSRVINV